MPTRANARTSRWRGAGEPELPAADSGVTYSAAMKVEEIRPGVFSATLTVHELSVLLAGARMSLSLMESAPDTATARARTALESVLAAFDSALAPATQSPGEEPQA